MVDLKKLLLKILNATPIGSVQAYVGSTTPTNWLLCDGSAVSRTTYAALFAVIGTTYGAGDGSSTFNLPDLRGRAAVGAGPNSTNNTTWMGSVTASYMNSPLGEKGGEYNHTLTISEMPAHNHKVNSGWQTSSGQTDKLRYEAITGDYYNSGNGYAFIETVGGGLAHANVQPYTTFNYIIYCGV